MLTGEYPFTGNTHAEIFSKISSQLVNINMKPLAMLSANAVDLIKKLLIKCPSIRIDAKEALKHPWFNEVDSAQILSPSIVKLLENYTPSSNLHKVAMSVIVKYLTAIEQKEIRKAFFQMDTENLGYITISEVTSVLSMQGIEIPRKKIKKFFEDLSIHDDGKIFYSDFLAATICSSLNIDDELLLWAFNMFDVNQTGSISLENFKTVFERLGKPLSVQKMKKTVKETFVNKSHTISFDEFKTIFHKNPNSKDN